MVFTTEKNEPPDLQNLCYLTVHFTRHYYSKPLKFAFQQVLGMIILKFKKMHYSTSSACTAAKFLSQITYSVICTHVLAKENMMQGQ